MGLVHHHLFDPCHCFPSHLVSGLSDNILKPILLGKGAPVPMLVIFIGVIGGFIFSGFIGLFTGAIVLSLGYKLFVGWINSDAEVN
jgi:predicted PurR-regulated permease PerM